MHWPKHFGRGTWGLAIFFVLAGTARAEAESDAADTQAILVTAQRREERLADVPLSLKAFDAAALARRRVVDLADLVTEVPGFTFARSFRGPPIFTLRGVGFNSPNLSTSSPVGFALDEMPLAYPVMAEGLLFDLARVEVLKGPQGTLFGRNTTGGLVRTVSARPTRTGEGYLTATAGSFASYGADGALSGPLGAALSARAAFRIERVDRGWQESVSRNARLGRKDKAAARLSLLWEPAAGAELLASAHWWRDRSDTQAPQSVALRPQGLVALGYGPTDWAAGLADLGLPAQTLDQAFTPTRAGQADWVAGQLPWPGTNNTPAPLDLRGDTEMRALALRGAVPVADGLRLEALASAVRLTRLAVTDNAGWSFENAITRGQGRIESAVQELRLVGRTERLDWVLGAVRSVDRVEDRDAAWVGTNSLLQAFRVGAWLAAAGGGADPAVQEAALHGFRDYANQTSQRAENLATYGQADWRPTARLELTLGLRYARDRTRFSGCSRDLGDGGLAATVNAWNTYGGTGIAATVAPGGCTTVLADLSHGLVQDRLAEDNLSGRIAVSWRPAAETLAYLSATRGFKSGAFPNIEGNFAVQYAPARQEELRQFEGGIKARPLPGLWVEAAAYWSDYRDKQMFGAIADPVFGALNRVLNIPRSHVWGLEGSLSARLAPRLTVEASAALTRTRVDAFVGLDDSFQPRDFAGAGFVYVPGLQAGATVEQGLALPGGWSGAANLALRWSGPQRGDMSEDPLYRLKAWTVADAALWLEAPGGGWRLGLTIRNLSDALYWNAVHYQGDGFVRYAAMPRTLTASLTRRW